MLEPGYNDIKGKLPSRRKKYDVTKSTCDRAPNYFSHWHVNIEKFKFYLQVFLMSFSKNGD